MRGSVLQPQILLLALAGRNDDPGPVNHTTSVRLYRAWVHALVRGQRHNYCSNPHRPSGYKPLMNAKLLWPDFVVSLCLPF